MPYKVGGILLWSSMTADWLNVDIWFGAFSASCAKKWAHGLVHPFFCVRAPNHVVWYTQCL